MTIVMTLVGLIVVLTVTAALLGVHRALPPGGYAIFAVVAGLVLVAIGKGLAALGLQRSAPRESADD
jgi:hypothetical protein